MDLNRKGHRTGFYQQVRQLLNQLASRRNVADKAQLLDASLAFVSPLSLDAATGEVGEISTTPEGRVQVEVLTQGLTGAQGALPAAYTEWAIERYYRYGDRAGKAFFDLFTHRLQCLRFLAWEKHHFYARAELREALPLSRATQALSGVLHEPSAFSEGRYASLLAPAVRSMVNLESLLRHAFSVPVKITPFVSQWSAVDKQWRCQLSGGQALSDAPMLGQVRWENQRCFRVTLGPLAQKQASRFFPQQADYQALCHLLRDYVGPGLDFSIELHISNLTDVPLTLASSQLGINACLGSRQSQVIRTLRLSMESTECHR